MSHLKATGASVFVMGAGIKPVLNIFTDVTTNKPSHTSIFSDGVEYKANLGAAAAMECAKLGAPVYLVSRTFKNLQIIQKWIEEGVPGAQVRCVTADLSDRKSLKEIIDNLPSDPPLYWLHSVGLGSGTVKIKDDNLYLLIDQIAPELIDAEFSAIKDTFNLLQVLLPKFRKQKETRIVIISSMSAVRSYLGGGAHCSAKASISRFTNNAMLELYQDRIFITDVRPGGCDTGLYDNPAVIKAIKQARKGYGLRSDLIHLIPPSAVGKLIATIFDSEAHVTSINLVGRGQPPHESS